VDGQFCEPDEAEEGRRPERLRDSRASSALQVRVRACVLLVRAPAPGFPSHGKLPYQVTRRKPEEHPMKTQQAVQPFASQWGC
jgi:hypothetical protein